MLGKGFFIRHALERDMTREEELAKLNNELHHTIKDMDARIEWLRNQLDRERQRADLAEEELIKARLGKSGIIF